MVFNMREDCNYIRVLSNILKLEDISILIPIVAMPGCTLTSKVFSCSYLGHYLFFIVFIELYIFLHSHSFLH